MQHRSQRDPLLDDLSRRIDSVTEQIARVKLEITEQKENKMAQLDYISYVKSDRDEARAEADRLYDYARDCFSRDIAWGYREDAKDFMAQVREKNEDLDYAYDVLNGIKDYLSELYEEKKSLEAKRTFLIRQHKEQVQRIKTRNAANWHEKPCAKCGRKLKYNILWEHIPNICSECKKNSYSRR